MKFSFYEDTADAILDRLEQATDRDRAAMGRDLLYKTRSRPRERAEQQRLFLGMVRRDIDLPHNDWLNARAAAAHKCLEMRDAEAIVWLLPHLREAVSRSADLPWRGAIRHNRIHVGFSLRYVALLASLFATKADFDALAEETAVFAGDLPLRHLGNSFFRSAANLTKCLGLVSVAQARSDRQDDAAATVAVIRGALQGAAEVRALRDGPFPVSNFFAPGRLKATGRLADLAPHNAFKEFHRAHRILAALTKALGLDMGYVGNPADSEAEAILLCMSNAYPGERDELIARFEQVHPRG